MNEKKEIDDGGPAFPRPIGEYNDSGVGEWNRAQRGMTLRQHYAGLAMQGMAAGSYWCENFNSARDMEPVALVALMMADALIAAERKR